MLHFVNFANAFCQFTASEANGSTGTALQGDPLEPAPEMPPVLTSTDCSSKTLQVNEASSQSTGTTDWHQTEKAKSETEMDLSDISNVSAARLVRNLIRFMSE